MSLSSQMGNVGSEVERCLRARRAGNEQRLGAALDRALELFDLTAQDARWRGARRREILRAREQFCAAILADEFDQRDAESLSRYFLHFAVKARRESATGTVGKRG